MDRELADHGLACSGRGAHQHPDPALEGTTGLALERVKLEVQPGGELVKSRVGCRLGGPATRRGVPLCGARHGPSVVRASP
jgi:hypothetical protein